ncbi:DNA polymerase II [Celerinatantimonas sp. YJH-8]|uniref:DNA polymerase II n=1 Tax=Celerinatantimonas sp. YJH-8 TaxID=3228714 RepID=UPI0038CBBABC
MTTGFLLNRSSYDRQGQPVIDLWLATEQGCVNLLIEDQQPLLFVVSDQLQTVTQVLPPDSFTTKPLSFMTFNQQTVIPLYFKNLHTFYEARKQLTDHHLLHFESDLRHHERYLMERFAYGMVEFYGQAVANKGYTQYRQVKLRGCEAAIPPLTTLSVDLECSRHGHLYCIGLSGSDYEKVLMIGSQPADPPPSYIEWVADEVTLLQRFIREIQDRDPDLLIGWNVIQFDCQLLARRAQHHQIPLRLGRAGKLARWQPASEYRQGFFDIPGRVVIDGIQGLKTATYQFDSFSLESVAQQLLGEGKLSDDPDHRMDEIERQFHQDKPQLAAYNLQDCRLVEAIFAKTHLIEYLCLRSQLTGLDLDRPGGSVAAFTNMYLPKLHRAGYIAPNLSEEEGLASPGGYVMDSKPGLYENVLVLDFKSLYPSIIRTFKIDPMGLIEGLKHPEHSIDGFLGARFSRTQHYLPAIIDALWQQRDKAKQQQDKARSQAIKILMNSFYGVLGSGGCRFYDPRLASSITMRGHEIMQQTAAWIHEAGYDVIYGDTDSTFVLLGPGYDADQAARIGQQLEQQINQRWQASIRQKFDLDCALELEFETHYQRFHMPTIRGSQAGSKKRYAGLKADGELIFKGLETVRSDWTELAKQFQTQLYQLIFTHQDPTPMIRKFVAETLSGQRDQDLIYRKRLRRPLAAYQKNIPPQVRAAREADQQNQQQGKSLRYQHQGWIRYLITLSGPQAVECQSAPIDYQHYVEKQLQPVADAILPEINLDFHSITSAQIDLF